MSVVDNTANIFNDLRLARTDPTRLAKTGAGSASTEAIRNLSDSFFSTSIPTASLATTNAAIVGTLPSVAGGILIGILCGVLFKKYSDKRKKEKIDQELKKIYKDAYEAALKELIEAYRQSEEERKKLIDLLKEMKNYEEEFMKKEHVYGNEVVAFYYSKGITNCLETHLPFLFNQNYSF